MKSTLTHLRRLRKRFETLLAAEAQSQAKSLENEPPHLPGLRDTELRSSNPGNLGMKVYRPAKQQRRPALVVVLHGCDQTAESYDIGSGWSTLADKLGFVLLYPEQKSANNAKNCFSWFHPADVARMGGEAQSIAQMVEQVVQDHRIDRERIFITGLSAGGAMTAALLATYPEVFAAGAIIGGIPYGSANSMQEAFECMFGDRTTAPRILGDRVRAASQYRGTWPSVSIWHGTDDSVVRVSNARELVRQWTNVHQSAIVSTKMEASGRHKRRLWRDAKGAIAVEEYSLGSMGHGVPIALGTPGASGTRAPFFVDVGISSTDEIAARWALGESRKDAPSSVNWELVSEEKVQPLSDVSVSSGTKSPEAARVRASALSAGVPVLEPAAAASSAPVYDYDPIDPFGFVDATMRFAGLKK